MRKKISKFEKLHNEADKLWAEVVMRRHDNKCFVCGKQAISAHHFIPKQQSAFLRYDLENGIPLCRSCHFQIHWKSDPIFPLIIAFKKGKAWVEYLAQRKHKPITINIQWLEKQIQKLKDEKSKNTN